MIEADKVNILLVDDQPGKLLSYEVILQELGENLLKATSGKEALEHLLKTEVAVVLMDVCMPELDGFELAAMIREHPRCAHTAIIFISAIHLGDVDRLRAYEMGAVDYVPVPVVPQVLRAKVRVFAELYRKTQQLEQLNKELEVRVAERTEELELYAGRLLQSEHRRNLALAAGQMGSWDWDLSRGDCLWDEGQCRIFGVDPVSFRVTPERLRALLDPQDWERLTHAWGDVLQNKKTYETEFRVRRPTGEFRWCLGTAACSVDAEDRVTRISGVTIDITDRKRDEERQTYLAREVDHRARNVLAVAQSIMHLTKADTTEAYVEAVEGRIRALSRAHMLLSESRWEGADLRKLANEELEPYRRRDTDTINIVGPDVLLQPRCAQTIALALHELATNAAKHGALKVPAGKIALSWQHHAGHIILEWIEAGGPPVETPSTSGYGTRVILGSLGHLGGSANFDWRKDGVCCTLSVPLSEEKVSAHASTTHPAARAWPQAIRGPSASNRVLLVEDEAMVAMMMTETLVQLGFNVIGPYATLPEAAVAAANFEIDVAILDINLGDDLVYPVADELVSRGIPFAFITGYDSQHANGKYADAPVLQKPIDRVTLLDVLGGEVLANPPNAAKAASVRLPGMLPAEPV